MMGMRKIIHVILLFYISQTQALAKSIANVNSYRQTNHNFHFMKVSTENDNNFGYEKITILVDNIPLSLEILKSCSHVKLQSNVSN
jgi:hypothetical protein